jgi:quinohemoprotein ethanol dehydrogenase
MISGLRAAAAVALLALTTLRAGSDVDSLRDGANWAAYGRTSGENHYSPLAQITDANIGGLGLVWFYDLPPVTSVHTTPLEINGVLYFAVGYSVLHAVDAKSGKLLWRYDPDVPSVAGDKLRAGWGSRGIAFWNGKVYVGTQDGRLIAVDATTGKLVWSVSTTEPHDGRYITGAPRVFNGKVIIGHSGGDFEPTRGYVTAYDAATGRQLWRFYTIPGDPTKGFEDQAQAMAAKTWRGEWWKIGGGAAVWNAITYDPDFNRIYIGTGNGEPWNDKIRGEGLDNLFVSSIVALDADSGQYVWHYQVNPGDSWDYDAAMDLELATLPLDGKERRVLLSAPKDGFFYVIDRETGKLLSAEKFAKVNWAERIDLMTGRPVENAAAREKRGDFVMYPGPGGAHSSEAMSFNPLTQLVYIPAVEAGWVFDDQGVNREAWKPGTRMQVSSGMSDAPPRTPIPPATSSLLAWDPIKQTPAWSVPTPGMFNGGTATTAGNLVFHGQVDGKFNAYSANSGRLVWSFDAQTGIIASPITYMVEGRQFVTIIAGYGGQGSLVGGQFGWDFATQPRRVLTFALQGAAKLPGTTQRTPLVIDETSVDDERKADRGAREYAAHCLFCHGVGVIGGGGAPDLRASRVVLNRDAFSEILRKGTLQIKGMPRFDELSPASIEALQQYIRAVARKSAQAGAVRTTAP